LEISRRNEDTEFKVPLQRLSNVTAELQEGVMKTRMQPIGNAWQKLPRIVRDLSGELGKQIELEMHGADTELDRQVLDLIKDPLTHMVRNSADHGLETTAERLAAGKPEQGTIRLSAYHEGGHIIICIADNGRGLNTERIKAKALQNGLVTEAELEKMTEAPDPQVHLRAGLLDRGAGDLGVRPRRRHGRGAHQYRPDRRHHRHQERGRRGRQCHHQDPADARPSSPP
jgi:two-component system chemotaxis sensor kinase CheA